jgi:signal transduction histidine kinase
MFHPTMRNGILILLLAITFVLVCLGAHWYGRRLRARARNALELRHWQLRAVLVVFGMVLLGETFIVLHRANQVLFVSLLLPAGFAIAFGILLHQFLQTRKQLRTQPRFVPGKNPPIFFWQGALILLPVVVLAAASLVSLRQDEQTAERDARRRAAEDVQSLARAMRASVNEELRRFLSLQNMWMMEVRSESQPSVTFVNGFPDEKLSADIAKWERDYPRFKLAEIFLPQAQILADGRQIQPPDFPAAPQPPKWFAELAPEQRKLWEEFRAARNRQEADKRWQAFTDSHPSETALQAGNLVRVGVQGWAYNDGGFFPSETGIEFGDIGCAQLLTETNAVLNEPLLQAVWSRVFDHPSILSPMLVELTQALTNRANPRLQEEFVWMQKLFKQQSEVHRQLASLRSLPDLQPWKKLWWSHWTADNSALALFEATTFQNPGMDYHGVSLSRQGYGVWLVPADLLATIFIRAAEENKYLIPPYAAAQFSIEGVSIPPLRPAPAPDEKNLLGTAEQKAGSLFAQDAIRFNVNFHLTSRAEMLSAERRRAKLFVALILGAALTALIGLLAARRAFVRQLQLNEQKSNFVSSVSHELRAPIASVRLMAENLERGKISEPAKQGEYFRFIVQECRRLSSLIENVLDFSRIEQGRKQYEFEPTNLIALVETTVKLMEPYAAEKGVKLQLGTSTIHHPTSNIELDVDGRAIQQALVNLIDNAVKHSAKGETVTVGLEIKIEKLKIKNGGNSSRINLSVCDHGPGIPVAEREKIFERFYRRGSELRRETQGVGIGLSIVKHIAEAHGGRVQVASEVGKGSRFTIELPVKAEKPQINADERR